MKSARQNGAAALEGLPARQAGRLRDDPRRAHSDRQRRGVGRAEKAAATLELSRAANVGVSPAVTRDVVAVDQPAAQLDVVGLHHRADVGQPVDQASVHLVLAERPAGHERAGGQGEQEDAVGFGQEAEVEPALQDQGLEAERELHGGSLRRRHVDVKSFLAGLQASFV